MDNQGQAVSIWAHLFDLRQTLMRSLIVIGLGLVIALYFYQPLLQGLLSNFNKMRQASQLPSSQIQANLLIMSPLEGIVLTFKICFWVSLALTSPFWGWIWLGFIQPGLKQQERVLFLPFLIGSLICLTLGVICAHLVTIPMANQYLMMFNASIGQNAWTLQHYVDYVLLLFLGHAIAFELGLILLFLVHLNLLTAPGLKAQRRSMIVVAFILGALLTPPDVLTQLLLALPLVGLYEIAILYAMWRAHSSTLS